MVGSSWMSLSLITYMTLLATRISDQIGASVVTDENSADGLNLVVKAGATLPNPTQFNRRCKAVAKTSPSRF